MLLVDVIASWLPWRDKSCTCTHLAHHELESLRMNIGTAVTIIHCFLALMGSLMTKEDPDMLVQSTPTLPAVCNI